MGTIYVISAITVLYHKISQHLLDKLVFVVVIFVRNISCKPFFYFLSPLFDNNTDLPKRNVILRNNELSRSMPFKSLADVSLTILQSLSYGMYYYIQYDFHTSHPEDLMTTPWGPWKYIAVHVVQVCSLSLKQTRPTIA